MQPVRTAAASTPGRFLRPSVHWRGKPRGGQGGRGCGPFAAVWTCRLLLRSLTALGVGKWMTMTCAARPVAAEIAKSRCCYVMAALSLITWSACNHGFSQYRMAIGSARSALRNKAV